MKNLLLNPISIFFCLFLLFVSSCHLLDENPEGFRTSDNLYNDSTSLKLGVNGLYQTLKNMYRAYEPAIGNLGTDEAIGQYVVSPFQALSGYKLTSTDQSYIQPYYDRNYQLVTRANTIIERGSLLPQTPEVKKLIAEARFLRAFGYFRLVQFFGPIPLVTSEIKEVNSALPRASMDDIYIQIVKDLRLASVLGILPNLPTAAEPQRVARYAVKALLGKVYLTMATSKEAGVIDRVLKSVGKESLGYGTIQETPNELYLKAKTELNEIVSSGLFSLTKKYGDPFLVVNQNNPAITENMWDLQFNAVNPTGSYFLKNYGMKSTAADAITKVLTNGCGLTQINYPYSMYTSYKTGDSRRDWNLTTQYFDAIKKKYSTFNPNQGPTNYGVQAMMGIIKYRFNTDSLHKAIAYTDRFNLPMNFHLIRYADVLLMLAEAELRYNGGVATTIAVNAINEVRNRARGLDSNGIAINVSATPLFPNYTTISLTTDLILEERKLELCYEGHRWFDLVRTGKLIEKYNEPILGIESKQSVITENHYLNPLPQTQIDLTTNPEGFFQNPR